MRDAAASVGGLAAAVGLAGSRAAAGLCLYPDEYQYRFDGLSIGPPESLVRIDCAVSGDVPVPAEVPEVVWRAGIDLNPLDVADDDDLRWLESLIWPGQPERVARLRAAARIVRAPRR